MAERTFTTKDLIDAMERNGYRKANGAFVQFKEGTHEIWAACAVGQALLNLGVSPTSVNDVATVYLHGMWGIYDLNDNQKWPIKRIAKEAKTWDLYTEPQEFSIPDEFFVE